MEPTLVQKLNLSLIKGKEIAQQNRLHIGVANVNKRLKLYYGNEYGLILESVNGKGTSVLITIPLS
jgi:two-component system sensor histidine kinase YesM